MSIVVGTAGHIDHGKTTLLRALTGIDADRLPEERRRGMTIDVGYAHIALPGGDHLDFVDVPGHDRLVGNMLVGAGEIDAVLLVVAADDGPRAQTREHLELLAALGLRKAVVAITKIDAVAPERTRSVETDVRALLAPTAFREAPILAVSGVTGAGIPALIGALVLLRDRVRDDVAGGAGLGLPRLAIDRVFTIRGRGTVVTGTLRGGPLGPGAILRRIPGNERLRVREVQVRGAPVDVAEPGRAALNLAAVERDALRRGDSLTADAAVVATDRLLVRLAPPVLLGNGRPAPWPPATGTVARLHLATAQADATIRRSRRDPDELPDGAVTGILRVATPVAAGPGDRFVLRNAAAGALLAGGIVLDPAPPTGAAWRRATADDVRRLAEADAAARDGALLALHGALPTIAGDPGAGLIAGPLVLAPEVAAELSTAIEEATGAGAAVLAALRPGLVRRLRRRASVSPEEAAGAVDACIDRLIEDGRLARTGDRLHAPGAAPGLDQALIAAMERLVAALDAPAPPPLPDAARAAGSPPDGVRLLRAAGRIVDAGDGIAWSAAAFDRLAATALALARRAPLSPAALRDATGISRRYVVPLLEELGRRRLLVRTPEGHRPGPLAAPFEEPG